MIKITVKLTFWVFLGDYTRRNFHYHFMLTAYCLPFGPTYYSPLPIFILCWVKTKPVHHHYFPFLVSSTASYPFTLMKMVRTPSCPKAVTGSREKLPLQKKTEPCAVPKLKLSFLKDKPQAASEGGVLISLSSATISSYSLYSFLQIPCQFLSLAH